MPRAERKWTQEHIIRELDALGERLIVESPVIRGSTPRGQGRHSLNRMRMLQAYRLLDSGWSPTGLAAFYRVPYETVESWQKCRVTERVCAKHTRGKRTIWLRICEAIALVRLDLWVNEPRVSTQHEVKNRPPKSGRYHNRH